MGKLTISMAIFNSYVKLPEGIYCYLKKVVSSWQEQLKQILLEMFHPCHVFFFNAGMKIHPYGPYVFTNNAGIP